MGFKIKAADGTPLEIADGEYYFNTKARARRMCLNSLSSDARRVYACLELATMGFQQELAVIMEGGEKRPLAPADIRQQTGLLKQNVTRGLAELEDAGLAQRVSDDKGALRNGHIQIYSWAVPRPPRVEGQGNHARLPFPSWFPDSWEPIKSYISRNRYSLIEDEGIARDYFDGVAAAARDYIEAEKVLARALEPVCAQRKRAAVSLLMKERKDIRERTSSSAVEVKGQAAKAEEEDQSLYQKFKNTYPADHFDEAKAKPSLEGLNPTQQSHVLERLALYLACDRWQDEGGRWIPLASTWLKSYDADPPPLLKKNGAPAKKGYVESLREEAERRIAKYGRI